MLKQVGLIVSNMTQAALINATHSCHQFQNLMELLWSSALQEENIVNNIVYVND